MTNKDRYAVLHPVDLLATKQELTFFDDKYEMEFFLLQLNEKLTATRQSYLYFSHVFERGASYPTTYATLHAERHERIRKGARKRYGGDYFVQRTLRNGKVISKFYTVVEDFDYQLSEWTEKGDTDIIILNESEGHNGSYYYEREIESIWGTKQESLIS